MTPSLESEAASKERGGGWHREEDRSGEIVGKLKIYKIAINVAKIYSIFKRTDNFLILIYFFFLMRY